MADSAAATPLMGGGGGGGAVGVAGSSGSAWGLVQSTYRLVFREFFGFAAIWLLAAAPAAIVDVVVLLALRGALGGAEAPLWPFVVVQCVLLFADAFGYTALLCASRQACLGLDVAVKDAYSRARSDFVKVLLTGVMVYAAVAFGLALLVLPGIYLAVRLQLYGIVVTSEVSWAHTALRQSWTLTRQHVLRKGVVMLVTNIPYTLYLSLRLLALVNVTTYSASVSVLLRVFEILVGFAAVPLSAMSAAVLYSGATQADSRYASLAANDEDSEL